MGFYADLVLFVKFMLYQIRWAYPGLWQYRQRNGQPWVKTINRIPGPSTVPKVSI